MNKIIIFSTLMTCDVFFYIEMFMLKCYIDMFLYWKGNQSHYLKPKPNKQKIKIWHNDQNNLFPVLNLKHGIGHSV